MTQYQQDMNELVSRAKRVITPLSPISIFAARNPWESLEDRTFDQVAKWIREVRDIDMYPNHASIHAGIKNGEIDKKVFEDVLQEDINAFDTPLSENEVHAYMDNAKHLSHIDEEYFNENDQTKLEEWVKDHFKDSVSQTCVRAKSADRLSSKGEKLIDILDAS